MAKRKKRRDPLAGKRDPVSQLYRAVRRYVEHHNGNIIMIGGLGLMDLSAEDRMRGKYNLVVKCLGKRPTFSAGAPTDGS